MAKLTTNELTRFIVYLAISAFTGSLFDQAQLFMLLLSLAFVFRYLYQLRRLNAWMQNKKKDVPEADGIWGEIFDQIYYLQKRNRSQKKKLASALSRFQQITAALPDGVVILQDDIDIEWCNDSAKRLLGIRTPHDIGQPITNLLRQPKFSRYLAKGEFVDPIKLLSPANEFIKLNIRVVPYGKEQKLLLARDMTRIERLEQARKDFIANASHELRTPLTVVNGYLESLCEDDNEQLAHYQKAFNAMSQQSHRMQNIVEDLLLLSRLENSAEIEESERVEVSALLGEIANDAKILSAERKHDIILSSDALESLVIGNYKELYSAVSNLVFNAVHYTPSGGRITLGCIESPEGVTIAVTDTGPGIPPQHIPRLTERFYRVDNARSRDTGGTGLGLAIVKHVLMRHNGRLSIESTVGSGSVFSVHFPPSQLALKSSDVTKVS